MKEIKKRIRKNYKKTKNILNKIFENFFAGLVALFFGLAIISILSSGGYAIGYSLLDLGYWRNFVVFLISILIFWIYSKFFFRILKEYRSGRRDDAKSLWSFVIYIIPPIVFVISLGVGFSNAFNSEIYETNKEKLEREELELIEQEKSETAALAEQEEQKFEELEKFGETLIFEESWSDLYSICTDYFNVSTNSYNFATEKYLSSRNISYSEYRNFLDFKNIDIFNNNHIYNFDKRIEDYCSNNFTYYPIEKDLWQYSARWLNEILDINSWISKTKKMCEEYPAECEDNKNGLNNFEYEKYIQEPAFKISSNGAEYLCFLHVNNIYKHEEYFEEGIYSGKSGTSDNSWVGLIFDDEELVENYFHPIGNQYFQSSVIFPKPMLDPEKEYVYDEDGLKVFDSEFYYLNPLENWNSTRNSITVEPLHFWSCLFSATIDNPTPIDSNLVINGFGPPIIRGSFNPFSSQIGESLSWRMWSIINPGPNSTVKEYEISEIYWFNTIEPVVEFCSDYNLNQEYLQAKKDSEDSGSLDLLWGFVELINIDFVNSQYCERYLRVYFEY